MTIQENTMSIIKMLDRPIAFQRAFVRLNVGITGALMLSQAVYWQNRATSRDGYFYKTAEDWEEETGLTRREQETARKKLRDIGVMDELKRGIPCKTWFKINEHELEQRLKASLAESAKLDSTNQQICDGENSQTNTEITAEITAETTNIGSPVGEPCTVCKGSQFEMAFNLSSNRKDLHLCTHCSGTGVEPVANENSLDASEIVKLSPITDCWICEREEGAGPGCATCKPDEPTTNPSDFSSSEDGEMPKSDEPVKHSAPGAAKKPKATKAPRKSKAEKLADKVRSGRHQWPNLNNLGHAMLAEWAAHRTRKNASDSDRALNAIEETLEYLWQHGISAEKAIGEQLDSGWTTIKAEYFSRLLGENSPHGRTGGQNGQINTQPRNLTPFGGNW